ncbi:MAG: O-antigen ligase family protein [Patescibacteria group bacterium]
MTNFLKLIGRVLGESAAARRRRERRTLFSFAALAVVAVLIALLLGPWKALGLIAAVVAVWAVLVRPELVVLFIAIYTPFEPFLLKFVPDVLYVFARYFPEALIYSLLAVCLLRLRLNRQSATTPIDLPFIFFLVVAVTSIILNAVPAMNGLLGIRQIIRFILMFFVVVYLNPSNEQVRLFLKVMFGIVIFEGILGLIQSFVGGPLDELLIPSEQRFFESIQLTSGTPQFWSPGTRVFATLGRFDQLGTFLSVFLLTAIGLLYKLKDQLDRRRLFLVLGLAMPAFILTLSRASWFGFALGLFVISAILMRDSRVRLAFLTFIVLVVGYAAYSGLAVRYLTDYPDQTITERFFEAFSYERWRGEYYGFGRLYWMVQTVTVVVPAAPLFGVGPGQYGGGAAAALGNVRAYQELNLPFGVYGTEGYIDNNWFSLWGETGTLGFAFYIWMFISLGLMALQVFRHAKKPLASGLALGLIGCLFAVTLQAMLGTYLEVRTLALYFWLLAAIVFVLGRREGLFGR